VNCTFITQQPVLLQKIVSAPDGLLLHLPQEKVDWVIGSAFGAITLAHSVAFQIQSKSGFTEKDGETMTLSRFSVSPSDRVLVVEDTISTGGSTLKTIEAIQRAGISDQNILPYIVCLVNRSGKSELSGREIRALLTLQIHTWKPEECPLCRAGSAAVRPKNNWAELTGKSPNSRR
jgi:orotate phosphoribosyltransferase